MKRWLGVTIFSIGLVGCGQNNDTAGKDKDQVTVASAENEAANPSVIERIQSAFTPARKVTIPAGTQITVRTTSSISSKANNAGDTFFATVANPVMVGDDVVAARGAEVQGEVTGSDDGGRVKKVATISLRLQEVELGGKDTAVKTNVFMKEAPATKKMDAAKIGIGAGVGAAIGAIAGGGKGAGIGAASGAGAGTAVVLATKGEPAVVAAESLITFRLTDPVTIEID